MSEDDLDALMDRALFGGGAASSGPSLDDEMDAVLGFGATPSRPSFGGAPSIDDLMDEALGFKRPEERAPYRFEAETSEFNRGMEAGGDMYGRWAETPQDADPEKASFYESQRRIREEMARTGGLPGSAVTWAKPTGYEMAAGIASDAYAGMAQDFTVDIPTLAADAAVYAVKAPWRAARDLWNAPEIIRGEKQISDYNPLNQMHVNEWATKHLVDPVTQFVQTEVLGIRPEALEGMEGERQAARFGGNVASALATAGLGAARIPALASKSPTLAKIAERAAKADAMMNDLQLGGNILSAFAKPKTTDLAQDPALLRDGLKGVTDEAADPLGPAYPAAETAEPFDMSPVSAESAVETLGGDPMNPMVDPNAAGVFEEPPVGAALTEERRGSTRLSPEDEASFAADFARYRDMEDFSALSPEETQRALRVLAEGGRRATVDPVMNVGSQFDYEVKKAKGDLEGRRFVQIDGDGLKAINDTLGHGAGNSFLRTVGEQVQRVFRELVGEDGAFTVHRTGGDEVTATYMGNPGLADEVAKRVRAYFEANDIVYIDESGAEQVIPPEMYRGVSVGEGENFGKADAAQYADKQFRDARRAEWEERVRNRGSGAGQGVEAGRAGGSAAPDAMVRGAEGTGEDFGQGEVRSAAETPVEAAATRADGVQEWGPSSEVRFNEEWRFRPGGFRTVEKPRGLRRAPEDNGPLTKLYSVDSVEGKISSDPELFMTAVRKMESELLDRSSDGRFSRWIKGGVDEPGSLRSELSKQIALEHGDMRATEASDEAADWAVENLISDLKEQGAYDEVRARRGGRTDRAKGSAAESDEAAAFWKQYPGLEEELNPDDVFGDRPKTTEELRQESEVRRMRREAEELETERVAAAVTGKDGKPRWGASNERLVKIEEERRAAESLFRHGPGEKPFGTTYRFEGIERSVDDSEPTVEEMKAFANDMVRSGRASSMQEALHVADQTLRRKGARTKYEVKTSVDTKPRPKDPAAAKGGLAKKTVVVRAKLREAQMQYQRVVADALENARKLLGDEAMPPGEKFAATEIPAKSQGEARRTAAARRYADAKAAYEQVLDHFTNFARVAVEDDAVLAEWMRDVRSLESTVEELEKTVSRNEYVLRNLMPKANKGRLYARGGKTQTASMERLAQEGAEKRVPATGWPVHGEAVASPEMRALATRVMTQMRRVLPSSFSVDPADLWRASSKKGAAQNIEMAHLAPESTTGRTLSEMKAANDARLEELKNKLGIGDAEMIEMAHLAPESAIGRTLSEVNLERGDLDGIADVEKAEDVKSPAEMIEDWLREDGKPSGVRRPRLPEGEKTEKIKGEKKVARKAEKAAERERERAANAKHLEELEKELGIGKNEFLGEKLDLDEADPAGPEGKKVLPYARKHGVGFVERTRDMTRRLFKPMLRVMYDMGGPAYEAARAISNINDWTEGMAGAHRRFMRGVNELDANERWLLTQADAQLVKIEDLPERVRPFAERSRKWYDMIADYATTANRSILLNGGTRDDLWKVYGPDGRPIPFRRRANYYPKAHPKAGEELKTLRLEGGKVVEGKMRASGEGDSLPLGDRTEMGASSRNLRNRRTWISDQDVWLNDLRTGEVVDPLHAYQMYFPTAFRQMAEFHYFGANISKRAYAVAEASAKHTKKASDGQFVQDAVSLILGERARVSQPESAFWGAIRAGEVIGTLGYAAIGNLAGTRNIMVEYGVFPTLRAIATNPHEVIGAYMGHGKLYEAAEAAGVFQEASMYSMMLGNSKPAQAAGKFLDIMRFTRVEEGNRALSSLVAWMEGERALDVLRNGDSHKIAKEDAVEYLHNHGMSPADIDAAVASGTLKGTPLKKMLRRASERTQHGNRPEHTAYFHHSSEAAKTVNMLLAFGVKQFWFDWDKLARDTVKAGRDFIKDPSGYTAGRAARKIADPFARFATAGALVGVPLYLMNEITRDLKDPAKHKEKDALDLYLAGLRTVATFGFLYQQLEQARNGRFSGLGVIGKPIMDAVEIGKAGVKDVKAVADEAQQSVFGGKEKDVKLRLPGKVTDRFMTIGGSINVGKRAYRAWNWGSKKLEELGERRAFPDAPKAARVVGVYDGDTVTVEYGGRRQQVRLLGLDAPEREGALRHGEIGGDEAKEFLRGMLEGRVVELSYDGPLGGAYLDKHGRLLAFVGVKGRDASVESVKGGFTENYRRFPSRKGKQIRRNEKRWR